MSSCLHTDEESLSDASVMDNKSFSKNLISGYQMKQKAKKETSKEGSTQYKRSIVSVLVHPFYPNYICVMQEAGDVHIVDATNGTIAYEYVAKAKINSNWAVDKLN